MNLTLDKISEYYDIPDPRIEKARIYSDTLNLHVNGVGLDKALEKINNYENDAQKLARDKFAISNKFITDRLLRPTDSVFSAKGGFSRYLFKSENESKETEFKGKLKDIYSGYSLSQYIHRIWFDKYIVDPNGLIFMEVEEDGSGIYPCYKSIHSIRNYKQDGIKVDWVIFEPDETIFDEESKAKKKYEKEELFWAVDSLKYYRCSKKYKKGESEITIVSEKGHLFKQVPAVICSDIEDHVTGWKKSAIDQQVELLNKFMVDMSVSNIVDFRFAYPAMWEMVDNCNICHGEGVVKNEGGISRDGSTNHTCPQCKGSGRGDRKDVTDTYKIKFPAEGEPNITAPLGYVYMPIDAWKLKEELNDKTWNKIIFSHWGTSLEMNGSQYATATGRFIDTQPVNNKLNRYTESVELIHNKIAEIYGIFFYPETFESSNVVYGRRYLIETPDQLMKRYTDFSNISDNALMADITWDQYLESEFRDNDQLLEYNKKLASLDPFPHYKIADLITMNMPNELKKKLYIIDYKNSREVGFILEKSKEELDADYQEFLTNKESAVGQQKQL